ncbi:MAG: hypothetical protein DCC75_02255 [Proteobacteria bacterium]|nr:MAG: hypothetical protein DCC75_02255 [Pseudomonadota bacterium]
MTNRSIILSLMVGIFISLSSHNSRAEEDQCSSDHIQSVIDELDCSAPGIYFDEDSIVSAVSAYCGQMQGEKCKRCFSLLGSKSINALRASKISLGISTDFLSSVKEALISAKQSVCSNNENEDGEDGDQETPPSATPTAIPSPGAKLTLEQLKNGMLLCRGKSECEACLIQRFSYAVEKGFWSDTSIYPELKTFVCGVN